MNFLPVVLVMAVALAASLAGITNLFAWDDVHIIELNSRLHGLANWREVLTSPYWPPPWNEEHYRPLTSLLLALQYGLGSGAPAVFRITSYLLYAASAVGVYLLAAMVLPRRSPIAGQSPVPGTGVPLIALGVALLFAAHPVHVEAVAPAVGQSELIVGLAGLVMILRYLAARRRGSLHGRDWAFLGLMYAVASLAKEHGLVLPALLVAAEAFLVAGPVRDRIRALWRGYAALAAMGVVLVASRFLVLGGEFSGQWTAEALDGVTMGGRALTMLSVVPEWARLLVWPAHLRLDYAPQEFVTSTGFGPREALGAALVLVTLLGAWLARRRAPAVSFGVALMVVTLLPVSNVLVPTGSLLAERTLFLPSAGFLLALGAVGTALLERRAPPSPRHRGVGMAIVAALVVAGVARSAERHRVWRHDAFLAVRSVQDAPRSYRSHRAYADVLFDLGEAEMGLEAYQLALELAPLNHKWRVRNDLARRFRVRGETEAEVEQLLASLKASPDQEDTRGHLIAGYLLLGRYVEAASQADAALAQAPAVPQVFQEMKRLADSAAAVDAPAGTVRVRVGTGRRR